MKMDGTPRLIRFGGVCALVVALASVATDIAYLLLPAEQRLVSLGKDLLPSFNANPGPLTFELWMLALYGVAGLGLVSALAPMLKGVDEGWGRWTSGLAWLGFAVTAVSDVLTIERLPRVAAAFVAADAAVKPAIAALWKSTLDPYGLFGFGAVGLWVIVASLFALRSSAWPRVLSYLGIVTGIAYWLVPLGLLFKLPPALSAVAAGGIVINTVWYGWLGVTMWRTH